MASKLEKAIELQSVSYKAEETEIIKNLTGYIIKGQITTIVGPSGAGKSTLFRLFNGLRSPTEGNITILNRPIEQYSPIELRRTVGLALQSAPMLPGTVYDNLALPRQLHKEKLSKEEASQLLTSVGLDSSYLTRSVEDLSGGQRQKVSIARTLVNKPKILLLDEITSSLDRVSTEEIETLILHINRTYHVTIVWVTHDLRQARHVGDQTWVLKDGQLIEYGESRLLEQPEHPFVQKFVKGEIQ